MHVRTSLTLAATIVAFGAAIATATNGTPRPGATGASTTNGGTTTTGGGAATPGATTDGATTTTGGVTGGVIGGVVTPAQSPGATPGTGGSIVDGTTVLQIVEFTQTVPPGGTAVTTAPPVPAGNLLVITDVIVTNPGTTAACGVAVQRTGGQSVTGPLCAPAQTTLLLPLTTGLEFAEGDAPLLVNAATEGGAAVSVHMRGFLAAAPVGTAPGTTPGTISGTTPGATGGTTPATNGTTTGTATGDTTGAGTAATAFGTGGTTGVFGSGVATGVFGTMGGASTTTGTDGATTGIAGATPGAAGTRMTGGVVR